MENSNTNTKTCSYSSPPWASEFEHALAEPVVIRLHPSHINAPGSGLTCALECTVHEVLDKVIAGFYNGDFNYQHGMIEDLDRWDCETTRGPDTSKLWFEFIQHHLHWPVSFIVTLLEIIYFAGFETYGDSYNERFIDDGVLGPLLKDLTKRSAGFSIEEVREALGLK